MNDGVFSGLTSTGFFVVAIVLVLIEGESGLQKSIALLLAAILARLAAINFDIRYLAKEKHNDNTN